MANDTRQEHLSSFIDSELDEASSRFLCQRLSHDETLRADWRRYHLIGDAIRREAGVDRCEGLAGRISVALEDERIPQTAPRARAASWLRPVGGMAVAASVAFGAFALLSGAPELPGAAGPVDATVADATGNPNFDVVQGLPPRVSAASATGAVATSTNGPSLNDPRMQAYLLRHNESAVGQSQGMVPYVYMVAAPEAAEVEDANASAGGD